jgi:hypothetical protein
MRLKIERENFAIKFGCKESESELWKIYEFK